MEGEIGVLYLEGSVRCRFKDSCVDGWYNVHSKTVVLEERQGVGVLCNVDSKTVVVGR